jgi:hypothetical protein
MEAISMTTIQQTVEITEDRHLNLDLSIPEDVPVGTAEMTIVLAPAPKGKTLGSVKHLAGVWKDSKTFAGDSVALVRVMRDEW